MDLCVYINISLPGAGPLNQPLLEGSTTINRKPPTLIKDTYKVQHSHKAEDLFCCVLENDKIVGEGVGKGQLSSNVMLKVTHLITSHRRSLIS